MELTEAIARSETDLATALEDLRIARELVVTLEADVKRFRLELAGLKSYAERSGLTSSPHAGADVVPISPNVRLVPSPYADLTSMARSDAVATVMRNADAALDRAKIHEHFVDGGRWDSLDDISLALSGLKRAGRVQKLGHGLWQLAETSNAFEAH